MASIATWSCVAAMLAMPGSAQQASQPDALAQQLQAVSGSLAAMQQKLDRSQAEIEALKTQVEALRSALSAVAHGSAASSSEETAHSLQAAVSDLRDQDEVLQAEVAQHAQTKVETVSKYPVHVTGMMLFSSFLNNGAVDEIDDPVAVQPTAPGSAKGSLSATMRQSILGLDATGPRLWGAKTSADLRIDFYGGLAYADNQTGVGIVRMRTAHAQLEWPRHSLGFALDAPLISPLSPTSFVAVGEPALSWTGNLWTWNPQFEVNNRADFGRSQWHYDFALMDPSASGTPTNGPRQPDAAEQSRQPGYEVHTAYQLNLPRFTEHPLQVGAGGYYSRQAYTSAEHVDAWAGSADWLLPIGARAELSGELYRGRALAGLGGGAYKDVVTDPDTGAVRGLDAEGGWAQFKLRLPASLEMNAAFGQDSAFARQLAYSDEASATNYYENLARNRATTANLIFRPKTYLLFTAEFRYLQSWPTTGGADTAPVLGLGAGYLF